MSSKLFHIGKCFPLNLCDIYIFSCTIKMSSKLDAFFPLILNLETNIKRFE